jgi:uncharacterized protein
MAQKPRSRNSSSDDEQNVADGEVLSNHSDDNEGDRNIAPKVPTRESVRTVDERLSELGDLPSLKKAQPESSVRAERLVDADARPPRSAPEFKEPVPSTFVDRGAPIPEHYGMDRLVNLPRDPHWVFSYWELRGGILDRLRFGHSAEVIDNARWVLRVRAAREMREYFVDVDLRAGQWYLKVSSDTRMLIDLGFIDQHGTFNCVLRGNEVTTPRSGVSDVTDERWAILREDLEKLLKVGGADSSIAPSSDSAPRFSRTEQPRAIGLFSGAGIDLNSK